MLALLGLAPDRLAAAHARAMAAGAPDLRVHAAGPAGAWLVLLTDAPLAPAAADALADVGTGLLGQPVDVRPLGRLPVDDADRAWRRAPTVGLTPTHAAPRGGRRLGGQTTRDDHRRAGPRRPGTNIAARRAPARACPRSSSVVQR